MKDISQVLSDPAMEDNSNFSRQTSFAKDNSTYELVLNMMGDGKAINSQMGMVLNNVYSFITLNRILLSTLYIHSPIVQNTINKPVEEALRDQVDFDCPDLGEESSQFLEWLEELGVFETIQEAFCWSRLYGGSAILIVAENGLDEKEPDYLKKLSLKDINQATDISIYALDRWQMQTYSTQNRNLGIVEPDNYWQVGSEKIHKSHFLPIKNKRVPSAFRSIFQGWGMSEVEKMNRAINTFEKAENVVFELTDEAKTDIYKIKNLNSYFLDAKSKQAVMDRVTFSQMLKNYKNALVMDSEDEFDSKTVSFAGLTNVNKEARTNLSMANDIPQDVFWGEGASGFSSGEDTTERYNAGLESKIRKPALRIYNILFKVFMKKRYGKVFEFNLKFKPLRVMNAQQQESIKKSMSDRITLLFDKGVIDQAQAFEFLKKNSLLGT